MKIRFIHFPGRFALDLSLYFGPWGINATIALGPWSLILSTPALEREGQ